MCPQYPVSTVGFIVLNVTHLWIFSKKTKKNVVTLWSTPYLHFYHSFHVLVYLGSQMNVRFVPLYDKYELQAFILYLIASRIKSKTTKMNESWIDLEKDQNIF